MLTKIYSGAISGINAEIIEIEVNVSQGGDTRFRVVGLPDQAVKESTDRMWTALSNAKFKPKVGLTTVNLAPADLRKEGPVYDLPIALGLIEAAEILPLPGLAKIAVIGELALSGAVRRVKGILPVTLALKKAGFSGLIVPEENAGEAAIVQGINIYPVQTLLQAVELLKTPTPTIDPYTINIDDILTTDTPPHQDFADIKGQFAAKRAIEVAVSGGHNILMIGSPGSGKTMIARRIPTILPPLTLTEALEATAVHSITGNLRSHQSLITQRPFSAPHHTISDAGLIGGGTNPMPGEVSLAHRGVLFLDELPEFKRNVLEVLRQPLEDGFVTIARAQNIVTYPSKFMLIAAMNPCPCGFAGDPKRECRCSHTKIRNYRDKISGPLLDRIDIHIEVPAVGYQEMSKQAKGESSTTIRQRVIQARLIQQARFKDAPSITCNADMTPSLTQKYCTLTQDAKTTLELAMNELNFTARAYDRIIKVARTIADMAQSQDIDQNHILEAIQYRTLDRTLWS